MIKPNFTERQMTVLDMIREQESIRTISRKLNCSESNVQHLRQRIREEIGLQSHQSLNRWIYKNWGVER